MELNCLKSAGICRNLHRLPAEQRLACIVTCYGAFEKSGKTIPEAVKHLVEQTATGMTFLTESYRRLFHPPAGSASSIEASQLIKSIHLVYRFILVRSGLRQAKDMEFEVETMMMHNGDPSVLLWFLQNIPHPERYLKAYTHGHGYYEMANRTIPKISQHFRHVLIEELMRHKLYDLAESWLFTYVGHEENRSLMELWHKTGPQGLQHLSQSEILQLLRRST